MQGRLSQSPFLSDFVEKKRRLGASLHAGWNTISGVKNVFFSIRQIQLLSVSNTEENSIKIIRVVRENGGDKTWK